MSWIPDEIGYAGLEHLDADYVAGYDAKAQVDPTDDIEILTAPRPRARHHDRRPRRRHRRVHRRRRRHRADVIAVDVSPAMVRHLRGRFADQPTT